jgi:hypothetical protein
VSAQHAKTRINQLKKWSTRYIAVYNKIYSSPGPEERATPADRQEFERVSAEVDDLLGCDECGSGGIEDAEVSPDCPTCVEFVKLWKSTPEVQCYTWRI